MSAEQVIVAAEVTNSRSDTTMFIPMVQATKENLSEGELPSQRSCWPTPVTGVATTWTLPPTPKC